MPATNHTLTQFTDADLRALLTDICIAEAAAVPGFARQGWVITNAALRTASSPPPVWVWLLTVMLEKAIPLLLAWLKTRYGDEWPQKTLASLAQGKLPWQS